MNWLRLRGKRLSLLALFALALQFGLAFGHTHLDPAFAKATVTQVSAPVSDAGHDPDGGHDACAICATIALANTLIDSTPPVLPVPAKARAADHVLVAVAAISATQRAPFQSRAPPQS